MIPVISGGMLGRVMLVVAEGVKRERVQRLGAVADEGGGL